MPVRTCGRGRGTSAISQRVGTGIVLCDDPRPVEAIAPQAVHLNPGSPTVRIGRQGVATGRTSSRVSTRTGRGSTELSVGPANGLDAYGVVSCDNIVTVPTSALGRHIGVLLLPAQQGDLSAAIHAAFDLD